MAGQQFEYAFDEIGNRLSTQAGGNLRYADYDVNRLIKQASRTDAPSGSEKCLVFEYDY